MGCDWVAVRNLTITLGIFAGFATTSVIFAISWHRFAPAGPWKPLVTAASFGSASAWCVTALVFLAILMITVRAFCACTAAKGTTACALPCSMMMALMIALLVGLFALLALCIAETVDPELLDNPAFAIALAAALAASVVFMGSVAFYANQIRMCQ